jgi:hypothetical protein
MSDPSVVNQLYEGTAEFGVWKTKIIYYIAIAIAVIMVVVGIKLFFVDQSNLIDTQGIVETIISEQQKILNIDKNNNKNIVYSYVLKVSYNVNEDKLINTINIDSSEKIISGSVIDLTYDRSNPSKVTGKIIRNKTLALALSIIGTIIIGFAGFNYWLSKRFKIFAAAEGVGSIASIISAPFRT